MSEEQETAFRKKVLDQFLSGKSLFGKDVNDPIFLLYKLNLAYD